MWSLNPIPLQMLQHLGEARLQHCPPTDPMCPTLHCVVKTRGQVSSNLCSRKWSHLLFLNKRSDRIIPLYLQQLVVRRHCCHLQGYHRLRQTMQALAPCPPHHLLLPTAQVPHCRSHQKMGPCIHQATSHLHHPNFHCMRQMTVTETMPTVHHDTATNHHQLLHRRDPPTPHRHASQCHYPPSQTYRKWSPPRSSRTTKAT